jgi:hypothetical protein
MEDKIKQIICSANGKENLLSGQLIAHHTGEKLSVENTYVRTEGRGRSRDELS